MVFRVNQALAELRRNQRTTAAETVSDYITLEAAANSVLHVRSLQELYSRSFR
jgi:hypothetical protein